MVSAKIHCKSNKSTTIGRPGVQRIVISSISRLLAVSFLLVVTAFSVRIMNDHVGKADAYNVIRVCQNKHCCKGTNVDILQTMHNLVESGGDHGGDNVVVEASGCLSHCDKGPNVEVTTGDSTLLLHGLTDAQTCAFELGELSSSTSSFPPIRKILIAASKVIEQSQQFAANGQYEEQIRFLTSVIDKLEVSPIVSPSTTVNADAHAVRAQAYLEQARNEKKKGVEDGVNDNSQNNAVAAAIHDAQRVVQDLSSVATPTSLTLAYRTWTDAELFLAEEEREKKDFSKVVAVLTQWHRAQPIYRTKLQGEIQGLLLNM